DGAVQVGIGDGVQRAAGDAGGEQAAAEVRQATEGIIAIVAVNVVQLAEGGVHDVLAVKDVRVGVVGVLKAVGGGAQRVAAGAAEGAVAGDPALVSHRVTAVESRLRVAA